MKPTVWRVIFLIALAVIVPGLATRYWPGQQLPRIIPALGAIACLWGIIQYGYRRNWTYVTVMIGFGICLSVAYLWPSYPRPPMANYISMAGLFIVLGALFLVMKRRKSLQGV